MHQANCIGPGIPPGTYKDINGGGGRGHDPCTPPGGSGGQIGNAGNGNPCVDVGYIAPWMLDMFQQTDQETTYL